LNNFLTNNYQSIIDMSSKICHASPESEEVAHFAIAEFIEHERGQELVDAGRAMNFISGIIHRSFHSSTSKYHTVYRQKNRVHSLPQNYDKPQDDNIYDFEADSATEAIQGILEDMLADFRDDTGERLWYMATLFQKWLEEPNFSELERRLGIPRTTISQEVTRAKAYIQAQLKINNINYYE